MKPITLGDISTAALNNLHWFTSKPMEDYSFLKPSFKLERFDKAIDCNCFLIPLYNLHLFMESCNKAILEKKLKPWNVISVQRMVTRYIDHYPNAVNEVPYVVKNGKIKWQKPREIKDSTIVVNVSKVDENDIEEFKHLVDAAVSLHKVLENIENKGDKVFYTSVLKDLCGRVDEEMIGLCEEVKKCQEAIRKAVTNYNAAINYLPKSIGQKANLSVENNGPKAFNLSTLMLES